MLELLRRAYEALYTMFTKEDFIGVCLSSMAKLLTNGDNGQMAKRANGVIPRRSRRLLNSQRLGPPLSIVFTVWTLQSGVTSG